MRKRWEKFVTTELPLLPAETLAKLLKSLEALEGEAGEFQECVDEDVFDKLLAHLMPDLMTKRSTQVETTSTNPYGEDDDDDEWEDYFWKGAVWHEVFSA